MFGHKITHYRSFNIEQLHPDCFVVDTENPRFWHCGLLREFATVNGARKAIDDYYEYE